MLSNSNNLPMKKYIISFVLFLTLSATSPVNAQEKKLVVLNLKTGYSVKGEIVEQTEQVIKIKTLNGDILEYRADEIANKTDASTSANHSNLFDPTKVIPQTIAKNDKLLSVGIGLIKQLPNGNSNKLTIPPIPVSFEYIIKDDLFNRNGSLGVGGFLGYSTASEKNSYWKYKSSRLIIGARGYLHYALVEKLDTYTSVLLGYKSDATSINYEDRYSDQNNYKTNDGSPTLNIFAGCRYFFSDKIAGMAEVGWGISIFTVGVTVKL